MNIYVPGMGNAYGKIAIVAEAPSYEEEAQLKPLVGPSGKEMDRLLQDAGIKRGDCWVTNVCKYMVPPNPKKGRKIPFSVRCKMAGIDLQQQINELRNELYQLENLNLIIALGGTALWAMTGIKGKRGNEEGIIQDYRGSILLGMGKKLIATYHPAHILHQDEEVSGYWNRQVMVHDLKRCAEQQWFSERRLPNRTLYVCKSSYMFDDFLERHKEYDKPAVDIEAHPNGSGIPICIGIAFTPNEGITIPLWNISDISHIPDSDLTQIWIKLARTLATNDIIGQNFKYDQDKIEKLGFIIGKLHSDTMLKSFAINPELPKNLAFNTSTYTEEPFYKNEGMYEGSISDLFIGCARDSCVTKEIDLKMEPDLDRIGVRKYYYNYIMHLHDLYLGIERDGFAVNETRREELLKKYIAWSERLAYERFKLAGNKEINVQSWKQVDNFIYNILKVPSRQGTGEEILTSLYNQVKKDNQKAGISNVLDSRRVEKTIGNYLMALPDFDGRMKSTYFVCLKTARTSTGLLEPPIRPEYRYKDALTGKPKKKCIGTAFQTLTKHGDIGQDIRSMYKPDPGYCLINIDSSQAEARVIFMLAEEDLSLFDRHDLHALTASWFVGGTEQDWSKKILGYEHPNRFLGKTLRHAGHLGAKARRAMLEVNTQARKYRIPVEIKEVDAEIALGIFHQKQPKIKKVFHQGVINALQENNRVLRAPIPYGVDADLGPPRIFFERWGDSLFRDAFSYIPQRAVSDNTKNAALRIKREAPEVRIIVESHDSLTFMVPVNETKHYVPLFRQEMERPIDFSTCSIKRGMLIIPSDVEIGDNYEEFKKYKEEQVA
jgi:uracil-DNA glycosylase